MRTIKVNRLLALVIATLVVLVIAGCGRRADLGVANSPPAATFAVLVSASSQASSEPFADATPPPGETAEPAASAEPAATARPNTTPGPTPDLASIEALLSGIDGDLGDDAGAAASEGSPQ